MTSGEKCELTFEMHRHIKTIHWELHTRTEPWMNGIALGLVREAY